MSVLIVTLSTKDNVSLTKQLNEGFKRPIYWNEYKTKIKTKEADNNNLTRFCLDASFQGVNRLFVLAFNNTTEDVANNRMINTANRVLRDSHRKYFLPRVNITNYNVLIEYFQYFKDHYQLTAVDLSKQKGLDADPRAIQQIEFHGMLKTNSQVRTVLEKSKETILEFYKGTSKAFVRIYKWLNTIK